MISYNLQCLIVLVFMSQLSLSQHSLNHLCDSLVGEKKIECIKGALTNAPDSTELRFELSKALCSVGSFDSAEVVLKGINDPSYSYRVCTLRGFIHGMQERYDSCFYFLNKAVEIEPNYEFSYHYRAKFYMAQGEFTKAVADFDTLIEMNPSAELYYYRGVALIGIGEMEKGCHDVRYANKENYEYISENILEICQ